MGIGGGRFPQPFVLQYALMFKRFTELILILKWPLLLAILTITLLMGLGLFHLRIDPSVETLFAKNSEEYKYYQEYRKKYGNDEMLALAMATDDLFSVRNIQILKTLSEEIAQFDQVERVLSLATASDIKHKTLGIRVVGVFDDFFDGKGNLDELREDVLSNELFVNNLVSRDGKVANILIYLKPTGENVKASGLFIGKLTQFLHSLERPGLRFYVAGAPVEQYEFIKLIRGDQFTFVPLITLLLIITTFIIYRSFSCMVMSMSIVFITLIWTFGTIALLGRELNLVTSLLAPVIMIVSVVNSIHLMNLFFEMRPNHSSLRRCVILTIEQLGMPCFLTHFTTIIGFISLAFNPTPAIQSFGIFAALGTFYSYIVEMLLTPILFPILPYRGPKEGTEEAHFFNRVLINFLEKLEFRWKWVIIVGSIVLAALSVVGIKKINVDTSLVKQMKEDLPLAVATKFIDNNITGVYSLGFVLRLKGDATFKDPQYFKKIEGFKTYLEEKPEIVKVNSITTLVKKIHQAREGEEHFYELPEDRSVLAKYLNGLKESDDPEVWKFLSPDFKEVRVEARMKSVGTKEGWLVEESAHWYLENELQEDFDYHVTGNVVLLGKMSKDLVHHQIKSFGFAFSAILILIILIFGSIKLGLLAAIPNLFPILGVYGFMGWMGVELSTPTAMISSIVLGMVVDASIHFLHRFRIEFKIRQHYLQALHHTFRNVGQALCVSTLILAVGFASSIFASFRPTIYFGLLTSFTIVLALICTLVILPVCLIVMKPFGRAKTFRDTKPRPPRQQQQQKPHVVTS